jgi:hypothetical protein
VTVGVCTFFIERVESSERATCGVGGGGRDIWRKPGRRVSPFPNH